MNKPQKTLHDHFNTIQNLIFIGLGIMVLGALIHDGIWVWILMTAGLLLILAGCVYHHKYFRCPHCGQIPNSRGLPKYCPNCGKELE